MIVKEGVVKRNIKGYTENGYFKYSGYVEQSDSDIINTYKTDESVKKICLTYYPIKDNKEITLLDSVTNYKTIRSLKNSIENAIRRLYTKNNTLYLVIDEENYMLYIRDKEGDILYVLKV